MLLTAIAISMAIGCSCKVEETSEYQMVTVEELTNNTTAYDGQKILVRGKYKEVLAWPVPACIPIGTGENPKIIEGYTPYQSEWGISGSDGFGFIGVEVISESGWYHGGIPNYDKGQEIVLKGIARAITIQEYCNRDIRIRSVYIEVNERDIDITSESPPKTKPESR